MFTLVGHPSCLIRAAARINAFMLQCFPTSSVEYYLRVELLRVSAGEGERERRTDFVMSVTRIAGSLTTYSVESDLVLSIYHQIEWS